MTQADTKERILDAAELLFAEHGFSGTSLRAVTGEAEVNLAAVNYHFGSKMGLFKAVVLRRVGPLNEERLRMLDALEARVEAGTTVEISSGGYRDAAGMVTGTVMGRTASRSETATPTCTP